jgi:tetratricopeptide (TPR) repeat protein
MINKKILGIIGLIVVVGLVGLFIYRDMKKAPSTDTTTVNGVTMTGNGTVKVEPIPEIKLPPMPSLDTKVAAASNVAPQVVALVEKQMTATVATLKKDSKRVDAWIDLGLQKQTLGDYTGARDAWEYAKALGPNTNIVPWNNLGFLYHHYMKDYVKSELNWKKVIELKPDYIQAYRGLFELYTYSYKEKASQIPVFLKAGIAKNPASTDLKQMLADYEKTLVK